MTNCRVSSFDDGPCSTKLPLEAHDIKQPPISAQRGSFKYCLSCPMIKASSRVPRLSVSVAAGARFGLTRQSSTVAQPRILSVNALLDRGTAHRKSLQDGLVVVNGFVRSIRKQKRVAFAAIGDGTTLEPLQAVLKPEQATGYEPPHLE